MTLKIFNCVPNSLRTPSCALLTVYFKFIPETTLNVMKSGKARLDKWSRLAYIIESDSTSMKYGCVKNDGGESEFYRINGSWYCICPKSRSDYLSNQKTFNSQHFRTTRRNRHRKTSYLNRLKFRSVFAMLVLRCLRLYNLMRLQRGTPNSVVSSNLAMETNVCLTWRWGHLVMD